MTGLTPYQRWTDAGATLGVVADAWLAVRGGEAAIARRQRARLAELVAHARRASPYFAEAYRGLPDHVDDVRSLPPTTKPALMARFDEWVTDPAVRHADVARFIAAPELAGTDFLGRYAAWTTSGATGEPAILVHDRRSLAVYLGLAAARTMPDWRLMLALARRGMRTAGVYASGGHYLANAMTARRLRERPQLASKLKVVSALAPLDAIVRELQAYQPTMLGGYPSALRLLADEQAAGRLAIDPVVVVSGGEALGDADRAAIAAAFGAPVTNPYACTEAGIVAGECRCGWQHVNADWTILEPVDADLRPTPPGERSHTTLLTYLGNRLQPILRYDLGDRVLVRPDPCPCGSPLPAVRVEGRTNDVLVFAAADGRHVPVLPLAVGSAFDDTRVGRYQLVQVAPDALEVRLPPSDPATADAAWAIADAGLRTYLAGLGLAGVAVRRSATPAGPTAGSGKFRQVWAAPGAKPRVTPAG